MEAAAAVDDGIAEVMAAVELAAAAALVISAVIVAAALAVVVDAAAAPMSGGGEGGAASAPGIGAPPPYPATITPGPMTITPSPLAPPPLVPFPAPAPAAAAGAGLGAATAGKGGLFGARVATPLAPAVTMVCSVDMGSMGMAGMLPKGKPAIGQAQAHWHWPVESVVPLPETMLVGRAAAAAAAAGGVEMVRMEGAAIMAPMRVLARVAVELRGGQFGRFRIDRG